MALFSNVTNILNNPSAAVSAAQEWQRQQDEAAWAAAKEEERRQERVEEQEKIGGKAQEAVPNSGATQNQGFGKIESTKPVTNPVNPVGTIGEQTAIIQRQQEEIARQQRQEQMRRERELAMEQLRQQELARQTPQSQEEWLQTPEGQAALANQQAKQANDATLRAAANPFLIRRNTESYPEYTGETPELYAQRNRNADFYRGRELMQPVYTTAQQNRDNRIAGRLLEARRDEDFYTPIYTRVTEEPGTPITPNLAAYEPNDRQTILGTISNLLDSIAGLGASTAYGNFEPNGGGYLPRGNTTNAVPEQATADTVLATINNDPELLALYNQNVQNWIDSGWSKADAEQNALRNIASQIGMPIAPSTTTSAGTGNPFVNGLANIAEQGLRQTLFGPFAGSLPVGLNTQLKAQNNFYYNAGGELGNILAGNLKELFGKNSDTPNNTKPQTSGNGASSGQPATMNELENAIKNDSELKQLYDENVNRWVEAGWPKAEAEANALNNMARQLGVSTGNPDSGKSVADVQAEAHAKAQDKKLKVGTQAYNDFVDNYVNDYYGSKSGNGSKGGGTGNNTGNSPKANAQENIPSVTTKGNGRVGVTGEESGNPVYNMGTQTSTGNLATESKIRSDIKDLAGTYVKDGTYKTEAEAQAAAKEKVYASYYDDYVAKHKDAMGEQDARSAAYQQIYDLGYRPDFSDPKESWRKYTNGMTGNEAFIDALEKKGNDYWTNEAAPALRDFNMLAGHFDRSDSEDSQFYDLTSELAGNAFANATRSTNYNTTPGFTTDKDANGNPIANGALQAGLAGELQPDQIVHFYDAGYSDLVVPEETKRWLASDSTNALQELVVNGGKNLDRLQKEHGTTDEFYEGLRALIEANPGLKAMYDNGNLTASQIAQNFLKAPIDDNGGISNPFASGATSNSPNPGYYEWNGKLYPIDQEKAKYYLKNGTYDGWDEGMRDYYNTFGTFYGYRPDWKTAGRATSSSSAPNYSYNYSGGSRSGGSYGGNGYYYNDNNLGRTGRSSVTPTTATQKQNRIYNIMKNWSF